MRYGQTTGVFGLLVIVLSCFCVSQTAIAQKASPALPQCYTCHDYGWPEGYQQSPFVGNCAQPFDCLNGAKKHLAYASQLHPGLFLVPKRDYGLVTAVLYGSPAYQAGIRAGDRVVGLNGTRFGSLSGRSWSSDEDPMVAVLEVDRGKEHKTVRVYLATIETMLRQWKGVGDSGDLVGASFREDSAACGGSRSQVEEAGTYLVGIRTEITSQGAAITGVLRGSPADLAGLQVGDLIVAGLPEHEYGVHSLILVQSATPLRLFVRRDSSRDKIVNLLPEGLSKYLRHSQDTEIPQNALIAQTHR